MPGKERKTLRPQDRLGEHRSGSDASRMNHPHPGFPILFILTIDGNRSLQLQLLFRVCRCGLCLFQFHSWETHIIFHHGHPFFKVLVLLDFRNPLGDGQVLQCIRSHYLNCFLFYRNSYWSNAFSLWNASWSTSAPYLWVGSTVCAWYEMCVFTF
jgi:hypothetical protein